MIAIGCDHGGFDLKEKVKAHLEEKGYEVKDVGCYDKNACDYPIYGKAVANSVADGTCEKGIVICTTGIGISIAANKVKGIRCGHCSTKEQAHLTKEHNCANVIALSYKQDINELAEMIKEFIETECSTEERHLRRVNKIINYEQGE